MGRAEKMYLLPLPAAARVALRRLGVRGLWDRGLSTADMTKVSGGGSLSGGRANPGRGQQGDWACPGRGVWDVTHLVAKMS